MLPALKGWIEFLYSPVMHLRWAMAVSYLHNFLSESTSATSPAAETSRFAKTVRFVTGYTVCRLVNIACYALDYLSQDPAKMGIFWAMPTQLFAGAILFSTLTFAMEIATSLLNRPYDQKYGLLELCHKERNKIIDLLRSENISLKVRDKTMAADGNIKIISGTLRDYLILQPKLMEITISRSRIDNAELEGRLNKISYKLNSAMAITYVKAFISLGITLSFDIFFNLILAPYIKGIWPTKSDFLDYVIPMSGYAANTTQYHHKISKSGPLLEQAFGIASIDMRFWNRVSYLFNQNEPLKTELAKLDEEAYTLELYKLAIEKFFDSIDLTIQPLRPKEHLEQCLQQTHTKLKANYTEERASRAEKIFVKIVSNLKETSEFTHSMSGSHVPDLGPNFTPQGGTPHAGTPVIPPRPEPKITLAPLRLSRTSSSNTDTPTPNLYETDNTQNPPRRSASAGQMQLRAKDEQKAIPRTPADSSPRLQPAIQRILAAERAGGDTSPLALSPRIRRRIMPGLGDSTLPAH